MVLSADAPVGLEGLRPRVNEIGRIRIGDKDARGLPISLSTFRLTSYDKAVLEAAQALYGGEVKAWTDAPDPNMWELVTTVPALDILIPRSIQSVSQRYELWDKATCSRRCDGRFEEISEQACLCAPAVAKGEDRECDPMTRISVILPRLPGLGVWRLDTSGYHAATTIPSTLELLLAIDQRPMVPAVLRAVQRSSKVQEKGKTLTRRFVVPVLDAPGITIGQLVGGAANEAAMLGTGDEAPPARPAPPTAADKVAARRQDIEQRQAARSVGPDEPPHPADLEAASALPVEPAADAVPTLPAERTDWSNDGFRQWLRDSFIGLTDAQKHIRATYGDAATIASITDEQRAATAAAIAHLAK